MKPALGRALAIATCCFGLPAHAAVSGFYDSAAQVEVLMQSGALADAVRQLPIRELTRAGQRRSDGALRWRVRTERCKLVVYLEAIPPQGVGRTRYAVKEVGSCR
jgi:hypothetical protein